VRVNFVRTDDPAPILAHPRVIFVRTDDFATAVASRTARHYLVDHTGTSTLPDVARSCIDRGCLSDQAITGSPDMEGFTP